MRKKFLRAAIATFAVSLTAGLGVTFANDPIIPATQVSAATTTTGLSTWTASGATISGDTATFASGNKLSLPVSTDYTLTFTPVNGAASANFKLAINATSADATVDSSDYALFSSGQASFYKAGVKADMGLSEDSDTNGDGVITNQWYGQTQVFAPYTLTVKDGAMTLRGKSGERLFYFEETGSDQLSLTNASGYIIFEATGEMTLSGVTYTDNTTSGSGESGTAANDGTLSAWTPSANVSIANGTATFTAGGYMSLPVDGDYTLTFKPAGYQSANGGAGFDLYINSSTTAGNTSGDYVTFLSDGNAGIYLGGKKQDLAGGGTTGYNPWYAQESYAPFTLKVTGGKMLLTGNGGENLYLEQTLTSTSGYIVIKANGAMTVSDITYTAGSSSGDSGTTTPTPTPGTTTGTLLQDFEQASDAVGTNYAGAGSLSTTGVTEGSNSVAVTATASWSNIAIDLGVSSLSELSSYVTITFDLTSTYSGNWYVHNYAYAFSAGTSTVEIPVAALEEYAGTYFADGKFTFVVQSNTTTSSETFYLDNLRGQTETSITYTVTTSSNSTGGSTSGGGTYAAGSSVTVTATVLDGYTFDGWYFGATKVSTDLSYTFSLAGNTVLEGRFKEINTGESPSTAAVGTTVSTQFDAALDSTAWVTNAGSVSGGVFNFSGGNGYYFASAGQYTNFVLEFDVTGLTVANSLIVVLGSDDALTFASTDKHVQYNTDGVVPNNLGGARSWSGYGYDGSTVRIRVEAKDGTVSAGYAISGSWTMTTFGSDYNTAGRIYIMTGSTASFQIDNLFLINSDEYADYVVTQKDPLEIDGGQQTVPTTISGTIDLGDMTNKTATFVAGSKGLVMDTATGAWSISLAADLTDGLHTYYFDVIINDLVIDGWVYPLGSAGEYLLSCKIGVTTFGGTGGSTGDGGSVSGDESLKPALGTDESGNRTIIKGETNDLVFDVDLKGKDITTIAWSRAATGESNFLTTEAYEYTYVPGTDEEGNVLTAGTFTLNGAYMGILPEGITAFTIYTLKGDLTLTVNVRYLPTIGSKTSDTVAQYSTNDVTFELDTKDEEFLAVKTARGGIYYDLDVNEAYTYDAESKTLTLLGAYISTLPAGTTTYVFVTAGGSVEFTVTVTAKLAPELTDANSDLTVKQGTAEDQVFGVDFHGEDFVVVVSRTGEEDQKLDASAYAYDATTQTLTLKADYVKALPVGLTTFKLVSYTGNITIGEVNVTITVTEVKAPELLSDAVQTFEGSDVYFSIDTYGEEILGIAVKGTGTQLDKSKGAYEYTEGELMIAKGYFESVAGTTVTFVVNTMGGSVEVSVVVPASGTDAPIASPSVVEVKVGRAEDVVFGVDIKTATTISAFVAKRDTDKTIDADQWAYADGKLTVKAVYVNSLTVGSHVFAIITDYGSVNVTINVLALQAPTVEGNATATIGKGSVQELSFKIDLKGLDLLGVQVAHGSETGKELKDNAYTYDLTTGEFTLTETYVSTLAQGVTTFTINTADGGVDVTVTVEEAQAPTVSGETSLTIDQGTAEDKTFDVDTKGMTIVEVVVRRDGEEDRVLDASAYAYDATAKKLTLKAAYVEVIPAGVTQFIVKTDGGLSDPVTITATAKAPVIGTTSAFTIWAENEIAVQVSVNAYGLPVTVSLQQADGSFVALDSASYFYARKVLTLTADYTDTLSIGVYTYKVSTTEGEVTFTVTVESAPTTSGSVDESDLGSGNVWDREDWEDWEGSVKPNTNSNYDKGYTDDGCGGSIGAVSGLALIGAAAVALLTKKKED